MARLIDGKEIAESIYENINLRARELRGRGVIPKLAVVLVGDNPASRLYVNSKEKRARENGIETEEHHLDGSVAEARVTELIKKLNIKIEIIIFKHFFIFITHYHIFIIHL